MSKNQISFYVNVLFRVCVAIVLIGALLKIMHWPYGPVLLIAGGSVATLAYVVRFSLKTNRIFEDWVKLYFVVFFFLKPHYYLSYITPYYTEIGYGISISLLVAVAYILLNDSSSLFPKNTNRFNQIFFAISGFCVVIGGLFKIMHWPGAGVMLFCGLLFSAIWITLSPFFGGAMNEASAPEEFGTLDESLVSEETTQTNKSTPLSLTEKAVAVISFLLMVVGAVLFTLDIPSGIYVVLAGFLGGGVFLVLTFRN